MLDRTLADQTNQVTWTAAEVFSRIFNQRDHLCSENFESFGRMDWNAARLAAISRSQNLRT
jgi:hypothetical protein